MVRRFLSCTENAYDEVSAACGRKNGDLRACFVVELGFGIDTADHADVRRIRTHDKRHIRRLPFVNREEGETCQHLATGHTRTCDEHIIAAIESQ